MPSVYVVWGNAQNFFDSREYLQLFFAPSLSRPAEKSFNSNKELLLAEGFSTSSVAVI
tara:strand:+ start:247 stop:420 length:174 start_codon:yes stop_codon:yes gene_type:complete